MKELDPLLHSQLRLAIMSLLVSVDEAEFTFLVQTTKAAKGNVSIQLSSLQNAGYIVVWKANRNGKQRTLCRITDKGLQAMADYTEALRSYLPL